MSMIKVPLNIIIIVIILIIIVVIIVVISIIIIIVMTRLTLSIARCVLAILCLQNTSRLSHACVWSCLIGFIIIIIGILFIIIIHILLDIVILFKTLPDCHTSVSSCLYHHHRQEGKLRRSAWLWINLNCHFSITSNLIWLTVHHLRLREASTVYCVLGEGVLPANCLEY